MLNPTLRHSLPWLAVAALGLWGRFCYGPGKAAEGRAAGAEEARATVIDSLGKREDSLRAVQASRLVTLYHELAKWQQIKQRVRVVPKWDTTEVEVPGPLRVDTVTVTREPTVDEIIEQANRTINACRLALGTCDQRLAILVAQRDSLEVSVRYWRGEAKPSLWAQIKQLPGRAATSTAIYGAGYMTCKLTGD